MQYTNMCGDNCYWAAGEELSAEDRKALLKEKEAILEAKLATIRHWIETADEKKSEQAAE